MPPCILITKGYNVTVWHLPINPNSARRIWVEITYHMVLDRLGIVLPITVPLKGVIIFE